MEYTTPYLKPLDGQICVQNQRKLIGTISPIRHLSCLLLNTFFVLGDGTILHDYAIPKYACTGMICVATWFTSLIYKAFAWAL